MQQALYKPAGQHAHTRNDYTTARHSKGLVQGPRIAFRKHSSLQRRAVSIARRRQHLALAAASDGSNNVQIGAELLAGRADAKANMQWREATVVENRAASADGSVRTLVLSVADAVQFLEGRRRPRHQAEPRWIDAYQVPGQFVALRLGSGEDAAGTNGSSAAGSTDAAAVLPIASSPIAARAESSLLDASIIEVLVEQTVGDFGDNM